MSGVIPTIAEKCKGAMVATAIGDALGWPNEPRSKNKSKSLLVNDYFVEWTRRNSQPRYHDEKILPGEYSDDTQMTLCVARSITTDKWEKYFAEKELPFWLNYERGGGGALLKAAKFNNSDKPIWESRFARDYFNAGGNGAVMRILPHVIAASQTSDVSVLLIDVIKNSIITHGHPRAILGATCYAYALNYLLRKDSVLEYGELVNVVLNGHTIWGANPNDNTLGKWLNSANSHKDYDYFKEWENTLARMVSQLKYIKNSLNKGLLLDDTKVLTELECFSKFNGAGDVAILAAIYLASKYASNPTLGIKVPAFSTGADTDTVASITGGLLGMLCGFNWIPDKWKLVQDYDCLIRLSDLLLSPEKAVLNKNSITESKIQDADWTKTAIGHMRKISKEAVSNGKNAEVVITKWKTVLGQTLYTKAINKLDNQIEKPNNQKTMFYQSSLFDTGMNDGYPVSKTISSVQNQNLARQDGEKIKNSTAKLQKYFVLDEKSIMSLLDNPKLNKSITIGKILKIICELINGKKSTEAIAKKYQIELAMVELISTSIISTPKES